MSKIKQTDISKLSQLEQQIEQLKRTKEKQQEHNYLIKLVVIFKKLNLNMINSNDELYKIMDKVIEEFNKDIEQNNEQEQ